MGCARRIATEGASYLDQLQCIGHLGAQAGNQGEPLQHMYKSSGTEMIGVHAGAMKSARERACASNDLGRCGRQAKAQTKVRQFNEEFAPHRSIYGSKSGSFKRFAYRSGKLGG